MRSIRLPVLLLAMAALPAFPLAAAELQSPPRPEASAAPGFVGSELCVSCHTAEAERLAGTPHGKGKFASLSAHGCETCHGPGSAHVENPEDKALQPRIERLSMREQSAVVRSATAAARSSSGTSARPST